MTQELRILAPDSFREKLNRRAFIKAGTATAGMAAVLMACGGSDSDSPDTTVQASGDDWSRVINKSSGTLAMYSWGDYDDPDLVGELAKSSLGIKMIIDSFGSNEELIAKLSQGDGKSSGFDIVVPTGPYIVQMIEKGLIQKLDKTLLPNIVNDCHLHCQGSLKNLNSLRSDPAHVNKPFRKVTVRCKRNSPRNGSNQEASKARHHHQCKNDCFPFFWNFESSKIRNR